MKEPRPVTLEGHGVRVERVAREARAGRGKAAARGEVWRRWFTSVPEPQQADAYIAQALAGRDAGHMLPFVVRELTSGAIAGSTRYHDIIKDASRVEIGYTWDAKRWQKSHVNTACKLLLLGHAFDALECKVVGLRTDNFNFTSQRAIQPLGAKKDGVLRHHAVRRDGTVRDSVMYSIVLSEWPDVKRHLELRLQRH